MSSCIVKQYTASDRSVQCVCFDIELMRYFKQYNYFAQRFILFRLHLELLYHVFCVPPLAAYT